MSQDLRDATRNLEYTKCDQLVIMESQMVIANFRI